MDNRKGKKYMKKKASVAIVVYFVLMLTLVVGTTIALLMDNTDSIVNKFTPSEVASEVYEENEGNRKQNVKIENTGDVGAYIRAKIVVTWQDQNGNIYGVEPIIDEDYKLELNEMDWHIGSDGYYYHKASVASGGHTSALIKECVEMVNNELPEGFSLSVEIIGSAIQADGVNENGIPAVVDAWGVTINSDGTISK